VVDGEVASGRAIKWSDTHYDHFIQCVPYSDWQYTDEEVEQEYEEFYDDVHSEFLQFGEIVNFKVFVVFSWIWV
jgi:hypothetical protein